MREEIGLAEITSELLEDAQNIFAEDTQGNRKLLWDSKRIPAVFRHTQITGYFPFVMVPSLDPVDLAPVIAKLAEVDPFGSRRLIKR